MFTHRKQCYLAVFLLVSVLILTYYVFSDRTLEMQRNGQLSGSSPIDDFHDFPCLPGVKISPESNVNLKCVRSKNLLTKQETDDGFGCTTLHAGKDTPICTYDPTLDLISGYLHDHGTWEKPLVDIMLKSLNDTPNMMLFDVGSNIGVYCISAAVYDKTVTCLDANYENIRRITKSLQLGGLTRNATLIWNAVSNEHQRLSFHIAKGNVGMSRIADLKKWHTELEMNMIVDTITLNDLKHFTGFKNRPIFMKMDVESHELFVLLGSRDFFQKVDVRVVQMELAEPETKWEVIELLQKYGFTPHRAPTRDSDILDKRTALIDWPGDVYFVRNL